MASTENEPLTISDGSPLIGRKSKKWVLDNARQEKMKGLDPYGFSPTASLNARSRNFCTSSAIAYFSSSIPLPVTAEIS